MKKLLIFAVLAVLFTACAPAAPPADIAATTLPVYEFTERLCAGTGITVTRLVTESVSCLHDYSLQTAQLRALSGAKIVVVSGAGLESFLEDALENAACVLDASTGIAIHESGEAHSDAHSHEDDPHIWLAPENARHMAANICAGLCAQFPEYADTFQKNLTALDGELAALQAYGETALSPLVTRELLTFHDGFSYFAEAFDLTILRAVEEEAGSEAPASELIELAELIRAQNLPAIFTETNGSTSAAEILAAETGCRIDTLDMAMAGDSYFDAMYHNIDTIAEALS